MVYFIKNYQNKGHGEKMLGTTVLDHHQEIKNEKYKIDINIIKCY